MLFNKESRDKETSTLIIVYELILGTFEITVSLGLFFIGKTLTFLYQSLLFRELLEDPSDLMARFSETVLPNLFIHRIYIAILLLALGLVKIVSAIGIINKKEWASHLLIGLLLVLIPFDLVGLIRHFSVFDLAYLLINVLIILFLIHFQPRNYFLELKHYFQHRFGK